jgi:hypothetical protein
MEDTIIYFGKYKGSTFREVYENDKNYSLWCLDNFSKSNDNQRQFCEYVTELMNKGDKVTDKLLKKAWYNQPEAAILKKYNIDEIDLDDYNGVAPELLIAENEIDLEDYKKQIAVTTKKNMDIILSGKKISGVRYYMTPEIVNAKLQLYPTYLRNVKQDNNYMDLKVPSKVITIHWLSPQNIKTSHGDGKWYLFFDRLTEDENKLTLLDKNFQIICNNYKKIMSHKDVTYEMKCSTLRPGESSSKTEGVILIYTSEKDRDIIIDQVRRYIYYPKTAFWKYHKEIGKNKKVATYESKYV